MSEWFPERQITSTETEKVLELCGGKPPQPEFLEYFLMGVEQSAFTEATRLKTHLGYFGETCADTLDVPPKIGSIFFTRGALFYARVLQELYPHSTGVPYEDEAFMKIARLDTHEFAWTLSERLGSELPSFCDLFEQAAPALSVETGKERDLALVGAGAIHAVAVDSLRLKNLFVDVESSFKDVDL
jgi:hypothetical protein